MKIQITNNDGTNSNITHTTTISNVTGLSMMVGGVKVDITDLVKKYQPFGKKRMVPQPLLPDELVMKIRRDASDMSELEARNTHKRVFEKTLELIEQYGYIYGYTDVLFNFRCSKRYSNRAMLDAITAYMDEGDRSRVLSDIIEDNILCSMNMGRYPPFLLVECLFDDNRVERDRWDRMTNGLDKGIGQNISPSAIYRKKEWDAFV
jgi:hypothetical protein